MHKLTLYVLRHGEAEAGQGGEDQARALTKGGMATMQALSPILEGMDNPPQVALVSPARRTRETQRAVSPALPATINDRIYDAAPGALFSIVQDIGEAHRAALLVGHNPGVQGLVQFLGQQGDEELRQKAMTNFAPGTLAVLESMAARWDAVSPENTTLIDLRSPPFAG